MSRWDYDTVFYRVFCITLMAVVFTFTVILTNVFVDIDGLLYTKQKAKSATTSAPVRKELSDIFNDVINDVPDDKSEDVYEDKDYQDSNDLYRSKRSLETPVHQFHIKDPKFKKLLSNHLAELLDELDGEEKLSSNDSKSDKRLTSKSKETKHKSSGEISEKYTKTEVNEGESMKESFEDREYNERNHDKVSQKDKDELLHLAMHNIILQRIIGSLNLDDVYKKVEDSIKSFESNFSKTNKEEFKKLFEQNYFEIPTPVMENVTIGESLTPKVNKETNTKTRRNMTLNSDNNVKHNINNTNPKDPNVIIKTIIDITALSNDKTNKDGDLNSKINGVIKLVYNGKTIKFKRVNDENNENLDSSNSLDAKGTEAVDNKHNNKNRRNNDETEDSKPNQSFFNKMIHGYFRRSQDTSDSLEKVYSRKRLKRHIKIRYDTEKQDHRTTTKKPKAKKEDDELFIEIETHFDSKGAKGEKKKKLIRNLIEKIQKAIHSEMGEKKKKPKHWHVKKRIQNPLVSKSAAAFINKLIIPFQSLAHRHTDPISKFALSREEIPLMSDVYGRGHWQIKPEGPRFFEKGINSAEMSTVDTDYSKVMRVNGIPQRLQKPLNTDMSDEVLQDSNIVELGNIKFLMKDIEGTGFSIGFNQYTDEAPDTETMKLFSGLQNIIQTYHQTYDQEPATDPREQGNIENPLNIDPVPVEAIENPKQTDNSDQHLIQRRSIKNVKEPHHHINKYKVVYGHNILPYENYQEIYDTGRLKLYETKQEKKSLFFNDNVFEKNLKPAEIFSIADLFQRRKREINVKKTTKIKHNENANKTYLKTHPAAQKNFYMQNKRHKRQIDKIRIIARDTSIPEIHKSSDEDMFVVSDEKLFADRALVKEVEAPEGLHNDQTFLVENDEVMSPQKEDHNDILSQSPKENEDHYDIVSPYIYHVSPFETQNEFSRRARHNSLMSRYPHIIMDETHRSLDGTEDLFPDSNNFPNSYYTDFTTEALLPILNDTPAANVKELTEYLTPPKENTNYRVSVKIRPKNTTGMSGFKEVHTSINKSYHKNGLMYTSLVNVSQLSKVEKVNRTTEKSRRGFDLRSSKTNLKQQHELVKSLIRQHRHRLDQQLKQLQIEREKLDSINAENQENKPEKLFEVDNSLKSTKLIDLTPEEVKKLIELNTATTTISVTETQTNSTMPLTTTTEYTQPTTEDPIKIKMISSIERNENVTNELLKKIDHNTGVLKIFLGKLIAKLEPARKNADENNERTNTKNDEKPIQNNEEYSKQSEIPNGKQLHFEDYHQQIPHLFFRNAQMHGNGSKGIPFVYAYQQPYLMVPSKEPSMASVVYHGLIHTNTMQDNKKEKAIDTKTVLRTEQTHGKKADEEFWKPKPGEKVLHDFVVKNSSKFFLDATSNDIQPKVIYTPLNNATKTL